MDAFLCSRCRNELQDLLGALLPSRAGAATEAGVIPVRWRQGLLDYLTEAASGQARLGDATRRVRNTPARLDGDDTADALYLKESGKLAGGGRYEVWSPKYTLNRLLATGKVNPRASNLSAEMFNAIGSWATHIASTNNLTIAWKTTMGYTDFLHRHTHLVALDEDAAELLHRVRGFVRQIEKVINRPETPRVLGPCPSPTTGRKLCATRLEASVDAVRVTCPKCTATHRVADLLAALLTYLREERGTSTELRTLLDKAGYRLPEGTLKSWVHRRKLHPVGWMRPDGYRGIRKRGVKDQPVYLMADVLRLMGILCEEEATA